MWYELWPEFVGLAAVAVALLWVVWDDKNQ